MNLEHQLRCYKGILRPLLDDVVTTEEERNEMIRIIYDESQRMGRLVTDLLDLARMESGHMTLFKENVPLVSVLERMTQKFDQVAKEKHVQFTF